MFYVYKVTILPTNQFYFGSRRNKRGNPKDLGETYFTSSKSVQKLIFIHGLSNIKFEILSLFDDKQQCIIEEFKYINEFKDHELCLNKQGGNKKFREAVAKAHKDGKYNTRNATQSKRIKKLWEDPEFRTRQIQLHTGRTWKLDPETAKRISSHLKPEHRQLGIKAVIGSIWINNGHKSKRIPKNSPIPEGYILGRAEPAWNKKT